MPKSPVILIFLVLFGTVTVRTAAQSSSSEKSATPPQSLDSSVSTVNKAISFFADLAEAYKKAVIDPVQSIRLKRQKRELGEKLKSFSADLRSIRDLKEDLRQKINGKAQPTRQDWQRILDVLAAAKAELKALPPYYPDGFEQKGGELSDAWFEGIVTKTGLFNEVQAAAEAGNFESAADKLVAGEKLQTQLAQCVDLFRDQVVNGGKQDVASACRAIRDGETPPK